MWNLAGAALPLLVGLLIIPELIDGIGKELFGILTLIWAAIGYFSVFDFGLGRALTYHIASVRSGESTVSRSVLLTGAISTIVPGFLGALVLYFLAEPLASKWLHISIDLQDDAIASFQIAALCIPLVSLSSGLRGMIEGFEDFKSSAILRMSLGVLNFVAPYILVMAGYLDLQGIVWALLVSRLFGVFQNIWLLGHKPTRNDVKLFDTEVFRKLLGFGSWMSISSLLGPIMVNLDRYLIAALLSAELVAFYTVPQDLVTRMLFIPVALTSALFPRMTSLFSAGSALDAARLYRKAIVGTGISMGAVVLVLSLLAKPGLSLWLGEDFARESWLLGVILLVGVWFNGLAMIPFAAIQAKGGVKITTLFHVFELVLYIPALYLAIQVAGLTGAAWVWTGRTAMDFVLLHLFRQKQASISTN